MSFDVARVLVASAARTATGNSGAIQAPDDADTRLNLQIAVTAVSGTAPTVDFSVEWSYDGTIFGAGEPVDTFTQITAAKTVTKQFTLKAPIYRVVWTVGGTTPSFTFSVTGYTN